MPRKLPIFEMAYIEYHF